MGRAWLAAQSTEKLLRIYDNKLRVREACARDGAAGANPRISENVGRDMQRLKDELWRRGLDVSGDSHVRSTHLDPQAAMAEYWKSLR
jgi:hypothetical protein